MDMQDGSKVKVGDVVWYTDVNSKGLTESVVTKVGTKRITIGRYNMLFHKSTMQTTDGHGHCNLIVDIVAYEEKQVVQELLLKLDSKRVYIHREGVTANDIKAAAMLLKIDISV